MVKYRAFGRYPSLEFLLSHEAFLMKVPDCLVFAIYDVVTNVPRN